MASLLCNSLLQSIPCAGIASPFVLSLVPLAAFVIPLFLFSSAASLSSYTSSLSRWAASRSQSCAIVSSESPRHVSELVRAPALTYGHHSGGGASAAGPQPLRLSEPRNLLSTKPKRYHPHSHHSQACLFYVYLCFMRFPQGSPLSLSTFFGEKWRAKVETCWISLVSSFLLPVSSQPSPMHHARRIGEGVC